MSTPWIEDTDFISRRIAEREAERLRQRNCTCRRSDDGAVVESAGCSVHAPQTATAPAALTVMPPFPDWRATAEMVRCLLAEDAARLALAQARCLTVGGLLADETLRRLAELELIAGERR